MGGGGTNLRVFSILDKNYMIISPANVAEFIFLRNAKEHNLNVC
jgi:hypothetical protein